jgi:cell cycle protein kinase DBF2
MLSSSNLQNSLINDKSRRMSTLDEVKKHPFYAGIQWDTLRDTAAPFIPALDSEVDTGYFDNFEDPAGEHDHLWA